MRASYQISVQNCEVQRLTSSWRSTLRQFHMSVYGPEQQIPLVLTPFHVILTRPIICIHGLWVQQSLACSCELCRSLFLKLLCRCLVCRQGHARCTRSLHPQHGIVSSWTWSVQHEQGRAMGSVGGSIPRHQTSLVDVWHLAWCALTALVTAQAKEVCLVHALTLACCK